MSNFPDTIAAGASPIHEQDTRKKRFLLRRLHFLVFYTDALFLSASGYFWYNTLLTDKTPEMILQYTLAVVLALLAYSFYAFSSNFYDWRHFRQTATRPFVAFRATVFAFGGLLLLSFLFKETSIYSRLWGGAWVSSFVAYILVSRAALTAYLASAARTGAYSRRAVIIGAGDIGRDVARHMRKFGDTTIQVIGFLDDRAGRLPASVQEVPVLGRTDQAERLVRHEGVDLVILALPWHAQDRVTQLVERLSQWAADIYMAPDRLGLRYADRPVFRLGGMNMLSLRDRPISEWSAVIKRIEDLCLAVPALIVLSPLLMAVAAAIKIESRGSMFFIQKRYGFNNDLIKVFKFRSMYAEMCDQNADRLTTRGDPRVTRIGRIIRKTNIDELPQILNVIRGDMSMVGPRPHAVNAKAGDQLYQSVVAEYASRHRVKPGITGWAQCNGWRGETDTKEKLVKRVEYDLYYIENWSVFLDIVILFKTVMQIVKGDRNAY